MVRARKQRSRRTTMATIGTFKKTGSNEFTGAIVTLSVQAKNVRIVPEATRSGDNSQPPRLCWPGRDRRRLVQALQRGPRLFGPQARRSELHRPDLRQPLRRRGRRGLQPHLVPPQRPPERLTRLQCPVRLVRAGHSLYEPSRKAAIDRPRASGVPPDHTRQQCAHVGHSEAWRPHQKQSSIQHDRCRPDRNVGCTTHEPAPPFTRCGRVSNYGASLVVITSMKSASPVT
jgi:hypothetical protein